MDYTIIGLAIGAIALTVTIISSWYQFYKQNKTLSVILQMQYDSALYLMNLIDYYDAHYKNSDNQRVFSERTLVISRRINKLVRDHKINIPELIDESGRK